MLQCRSGEVLRRTRAEAGQTRVCECFSWSSWVNGALAVLRLLVKAGENAGGRILCKNGFFKGTSVLEWVRTTSSSSRITALTPALTPAHSEPGNSSGLKKIISEELAWPGSAVLILGVSLCLKS